MQNYAYWELGIIGGLTAITVIALVVLTVLGRAIPASLTTALGALIGWLSRSAASNGKTAWMEANGKSVVITPPP